MAVSFRLPFGNRPRPLPDATMVGVQTDDWHAPRPDDLRAGPYHLDQQIDAGGESLVWLATDTQRNTPAAVKVQRFNVHSDRLRREAAVLYALQSVKTPNVVKLLPAREGGVLDHEPGVMRTSNAIELRYCALERLPSRESRNVMRKMPLKREDVLEVCYALRATLRVMHLDFRMLHNDLKPDNVVAWRDGRDGPLHVRLLDYGQAALLGPHPRAALPCVVPEPMHHYVYVYGSHPYMAPERWHGKLHIERLRARSAFDAAAAAGDWPQEAIVDERADQWSLGATVFELLTGKRLVAGPSDEQRAATIVNGHYLNTIREARLSPRIKEVLNTALALDPAHRYPPAPAVSGLDRFCTALEAALP